MKAVNVFKFDHEMAIEGSHLDMAYQGKMPVMENKGDIIQVPSIHTDRYKIRTLRVFDEGKLTETNFVILDAAIERYLLHTEKRLDDYEREVDAGYKLVMTHKKLWRELADLVQLSTFWDRLRYLFTGTLSRHVE